MPRGRPRRSPSPDDPLVGAVLGQPDDDENPDDADEENPENRIIGPGINDLVEEPTLPGFIMEDDPDELAPTDRNALPSTHPIDAVAPAALDGELLPPKGRHGAGQNIRYESRIRVLEAFQYRGSLQDAPAWVDRNWAGYGDWDPLRNIAAGPALRVPSPHGDVVLARPGDYVVRQSVTIAHHVEPIEQVEVWARDNFERTFIPASLT